MSSELDSMFDIVNFFSNEDESNIIRVGDPKAVEKFYNALKRDYNVEEMKDILDCDENMLIISCAGSGKTTTLILKLIRDFLSGKFRKKVVVNGIETQTTSKILVTTFLKSGALELSQRFRELIQRYNIKGIDVNSVAFKTIHSEVYGSLKDMGVMPNIISESETYKYIKKACKDYGIHSFASGRKKDLTNEEVSDIACILTYARNRLDDSKYTHPLMDEYNIHEIELKAILDEFKLLKRKDGVQDFEDLEEILYDGYGKFPKVVQYIQSKYDYIYLDEFQDTSQLQYAILVPYLKGATGFMALGDDDQVIYGWRGSDVSLIQEKFEKDYNPVVKKLTINYRCLENILLPVIPSIEKNSNRHKKDLKAANKGGKVEIVVDGGASYLMKSVREDLKRSEKIGILARTNADLLIPAVLLEIDGYSSFSLSNSVSLTDRIPTQVLGVMDLMAKRYDENFEMYFKMFLSKYNVYEATKLADTLSSNSQWNIYNMDLGDLEYSTPSLFNIIRMLRQVCKYNNDTKEFEGDRKKAYINLLDIIEQDVFNGKTIYAQRARDFTYYIKKIITSHEKVKDLSFEEIYKLFRVDLPESFKKKQPQKAKRVKKADGSWVTENPPPDNSFVKITTVHDAKGKQWDNVYIWNDVNGCFPNSVGSRELTNEEYEEERRIHYIAWTRAVKKLTVFTRSDRMDGFLTECELSDVEWIELDENKRKVATPNSVKKVENQSVKKDTQSVAEKKEPTIKDLLQEYFKKYTSYNFVCSPKGVILDKCLMHYGSLEALEEELKKNNLEDYVSYMIDTPFEAFVSDILEDLVKKMS